MLTRVELLNKVTPDYWPHLLARMQSDCRYVLGACGGSKAAYKHLWAGDPAEQITYMKWLMETLGDPGFITMEEIDEYAKALGVSE